MTEYTQDISGDLMEMLKYYHQSSEVTFTAYEWRVAMKLGTPSGCVAVRIRETDNGGRVTYLTAKDVATLGGKNIEQDKP